MMRTARSLTVSGPGGLVWSRGCLVRGEVPGPGGGAWSGVGGCLVPAGAWSGGAWSGGMVSQHALRQNPPPVDRILDTRF